MGNLTDGILQELNRNRELLEAYKELPTGAFGASQIEAAIRQGEAALSSGDVTRMVVAYDRLSKSE